MAQQPLISIIVPAYNVSNYLDSCVESIEALTFQDFEVILVDDGSTDGTGKLCDAWADRDPRIQVVHQKNQGLSGARNTGIDRARGTWLLFVDSDDRVQPDLASVLLDTAEKQASDLVLCGYNRIDEQGRYLSSRSFDANLSGGLDNLVRLILEDTLNPSAWAKLFNRRLFTNIRFAPGKKFEDAFLWADVLRVVPQLSFACVSECLYDYRQNQAGLMRTYDDEREADLIVAWDAVCDAYRQRYDGTGLEELTFRWAYVRFLYLDRASLHGRDLASPLCINAIEALKSSRREILSSPLFTRQRKLTLVLLIISPRLYAWAVRRPGRD